jgi:hypothetical protein
MKHWLEMSLKIGFLQVIITTVCISVSACSSVPDYANVIALGSDTYRLTSRMPFSNPTSGQKMALIEAENYCSSLQREASVLLNKRDSDFVPFEITFKCVNPTERTFPVYIKTPAPLVFKEK